MNKENVLSLVYATYWGAAVFEDKSLSDAERVEILKNMHVAVAAISASMLEDYGVEPYVRGDLKEEKERAMRDYGQGLFEISVPQNSVTDALEKVMGKSYEDGVLIAKQAMMMNGFVKLEERGDTLVYSDGDDEMRIIKTVEYTDPNDIMSKGVTDAYGRMYEDELLDEILDIVVKDKHDWRSCKSISGDVLLVEIDGDNAVLQHITEVVYRETAELAEVLEGRAGFTADPELVVELAKKVSEASGKKVDGPSAFRLL